MYRIKCLFSWIFVSVLLLFASVFAYGIMDTIVLKIEASVFVHYIITIAVVLGYIALEVLTFISFIVEGL